MFDYHVIWHHHRLNRNYVRIEFERFKDAKIAEYVKISREKMSIRQIEVDAST